MSSNHAEPFSSFGFYIICVHIAVSYILTTVQETENNHLTKPARGHQCEPGVRADRDRKLLLDSSPIVSPQQRQDSDRGSSLNPSQTVRLPAVITG